MREPESVQKIIMVSLFERLKEKNLRFCVLKNYYNLPYIEIGSDVDILIDKMNNRIFLDILSEVCYKHRLTIFQIIRAGSSEVLYRIQKNINKKEKCLFQIDVRSSFDYYGALYVTANEILSNRQSFKNFYIAAPVHESIVCWLPSFLYGGSIKEQYKDFIRTVAKSNEIEFKDQLVSIIGKRLTEQIHDSILREDWQNISRYRFFVRASIISTSLLKRSISSLVNFGKHLLRSLRYYVSPPGFFVVFIGPDGSGKTTIANKIFSILKKSFRSDEKCLNHWRPGFIPQLNNLYYKLGGRKKISSGDIGKPTRNKKTNIISSLFRLFYYSLDFVIGYFLLVRPRLYRGMMVIFDRYYHNFIVDPYRSRINLSPFIVKLFMYLIPMPDAVIYLDNKPEIILRRKQELSIKEIKRQVEICRDLTSSLRNGYIVDGNRPVDDVANEVVDIILRIHSRQR